MVSIVIVMVNNSTINTADLLHLIIFILGKAFAKSFMTRMGYVKRKGTKAASKTPLDYPDLKSQFHQRIAEVCVMLAYGALMYIV